MSTTMHSDDRFEMLLAGVYVCVCARERVSLLLFKIYEEIGIRERCTN